MIGGIYGKTPERARIQLIEIIKRYKQIKIEIEWRRQNEVKFVNGDVWIALPYNPSKTRGRRFHIVYIDRQICDDAALGHIKTCLTRMPFGAYNYFW